MLFRFLAFFACMSLVAVAGVSLTIAAVAALMLDALVWPSHSAIRFDPTPRSIFETRRAGLA